MFEQSYKEYQSLESDLNSLSGDRSQYSFMVHSVPNKANLQKFIDSISHHAEYLFVSTSDKDYYNNFGGKWQQFVKSVPT